MSDDEDTTTSKSAPDNIGTEKPSEAETSRSKGVSAARRRVTAAQRRVLACVAEILPSWIDSICERRLDVNDRAGSLDHPREDVENSVRADVDALKNKAAELVDEYLGPRLSMWPEIPSPGDVSSKSLTPVNVDEFERRERRLLGEFGKLLVEKNVDKRVVIPPHQGPRRQVPIALPPTYGPPVDAPWRGTTGDALDISYTGVLPAGEDTRKALDDYNASLSGLQAAAVKNKARASK